MEGHPSILHARLCPSLPLPVAPPSASTDRSGTEPKMNGCIDPLELAKHLVGRDKSCLVEPLYKSLLNSPIMQRSIRPYSTTNAFSEGDQPDPAILRVVLPYAVHFPLPPSLVIEDKDFNQRYSHLVEIPFQSMRQKHTHRPSKHITLAAHPGAIPSLVPPLYALHPWNSPSFSHSGIPLLVAGPQCFSLRMHMFSLQALSHRPRRRGLGQSSCRFRVLLAAALLAQPQEHPLRRPAP